MDLAHMLEEFVDRLVNEKGLQNLETEVLVELKQDLQGRLEERVNSIIIAKLPADKLEDFEKLLDREATDDETRAFCLANIPDLDQAIATELLDFRRTYLGS